MTGASDGVAVVGGGTGALGRAVVDMLSAQGRRVVVPARSPDAAGLPGAVSVVRCDLTSPEDVDALAARVAALGPWSALVNCSGGYAGGRAHEVGDDEVLAQLELNLLGHWRMARAAARAMLARGVAGRIVNVVGRAAVDVASGQAAYQVAKAGAARLTQVMARELRDHGITVNAVLPGTMDTASNRASMPSADVTRWVPVERVAAVVGWLLSPEAEIVSGALVPVYGRS